MFNFFKKRREEKKIQIAERERIDQERHAARMAVLREQTKLQKRIFNRYPIGSICIYMGITMRVTEHCRYIPTLYLPFAPPILGRKPLLGFDYVGKDGVIKASSFSCEEIDSW